MSVNKHLPHLFVLPEDDANRQIANGFLLEVKQSRQLQVLNEAGGWRNVYELFLEDHLSAMRSIGHRYFVMLIDFDGKPDRREFVASMIPEEVRQRIFVVGSLTNPETLRSAEGASYETIGRRLARECNAAQRPTWRCAQLGHNGGELARLTTLCGFLF